LLLPESLIDLAGLQVGAEDFLGAVLSTAVQPIWVVDQEGVIRFANPAAITALGYGGEEELLGRHSHDTIHHSHPDGTRYPADECVMLLPRTTGETVSRDLDWFFRRDGSMFRVSYVSAPIELVDGRGAVVAFTDIEDRLRAEDALRERDETLASQQASLRRVAALVARGAASADVLAAIAREVAEVIALPMVAVWRYEAGPMATVVGEWSDRPHPFRVGTCWPLDGPTIAAKVLASGRPARIEGFGHIPGAIAGAARGAGIGSCAGAPIVLDGRIWGVMSADTFEGAPLAEGIEARLAEFTALVATAISHSASREALVELADEQAALRRVATLVARECPAEEVFAAVAAEVGRLLAVPGTAMLRYETDGTETIVAQWGHGVPDAAQDSTIACPVVVGGRPWGRVVASRNGDDPLPPEAEARIGKFTELVATAISNVQARSDLAASRARIVAAADDERRRVVRDLHDGAQQRLVNTMVTLKLADQALRAASDELPALLREALDEAEQAITDLRELSHGILPTVLTCGGLRSGIGALAARTAVDVDVDVCADRLPAAVEATAYFVVAEALTNVAKHAHATRATVRARLRDSELELEVRDDGTGGAHLHRSGLLGLADRVAALDGRLRVESPDSGGTVVAARIPVPRG
jgi:PAS domain S-box-containing protein